MLKILPFDSFLSTLEPVSIQSKYSTIKLFAIATTYIVFTKMSLTSFSSILDILSRHVFADSN